MNSLPGKASRSADDFFAPASVVSSPPEAPARWSLPWMVLPLLGVAWLLFLRRSDVFVHPQFWAEDGEILFLGARVWGWQSLFAPFPAYYILTQRLVACLATDLPARWIPWAYCYAALACMLLTAWFCLRARLDHLMGRRGRIALALGLVLAPQSGEVLMSLINSQWILMPILVILILQQPPSRWTQAIPDFLGLLLAGMTGPFIVLFAPWFLLRLRKVTGGWSRYNLLLLTVVGVITTLQVVTICRELAPHPPFSRDPAAWTKELGFLLPGGLFFGQTAPTALGRVFYLISPALLGLLGWALWTTEAPRRWAVLTLLGCGGAVYAGGLVSLPSNFATYLTSFGPGGRYFYAFHLFAVWTGVVFYHDPSKRLQGAARVALCMILLSSASHFTIGVNPNLHWEKYARRLDAGEAMKDIPLLPNWHLEVPARE